MDSGSRIVIQIAQFIVPGVSPIWSWDPTETPGDESSWLYRQNTSEIWLNPQNYHNLTSFVPNHRIDFDEGHYWTTIILPRWITTSIDFPFFQVNARGISSRNVLWRNGTIKSKNVGVTIGNRTRYFLHVSWKR